VPRHLQSRELVFFFAAVLSVAALIVLPGEAFAQGGVKGSIIGMVTAGDGQPLKGVRLTARSDTQIGGPKVTYSDAEGNFRFVDLAPGTFELQASAPKLRTVVRKGIRVGINAPAEADVLMEVEGTVEEVTVVDRAPIVSTTTASVRETYDESFIDALPLENRTQIEEFVGNNVPGTSHKGPTTFRNRGASPNQNIVLAEGFTLTELRPPMAAAAAMEVQTAGYGAENADVPGGVVNLVTKTGSNRFEVDVSGFHEDSLLRAFRDSADVEARSWSSAINPTIAGPLVKDRLWYYVNTELRASSQSRDKDPTGLLPDPPSRTKVDFRATTKLTWQISPRNKLTSFSSFLRWVTRNDEDGLSFHPDAQKRQDQLNYFTGLIWEALLSDTLLLRSQAGIQHVQRNELPMLCEERPLDCFHEPQVRQVYPRAIRFGNFDELMQRTHDNVELVGALEWFPVSRVFGEHGVKLRSRFFTTSFREARALPGDHYTEYNGATPTLRRTYFSNDPRVEGQRRSGWRILGADSWVANQSLTDSIRIGRTLTVTPGLSFSVAESRAESFELASQAFTPHLAVAWDATGDGRTALRGSFNQYVDLSVNTRSQFMLGGQVYEECRANAETGAFDQSCRYGGGAARRTVGLPCGPTGYDALGQPCQEKLKVPRIWEYTAGAEREILPGVALGTDFVYRRYTNPYEERETNRVWNAAGTGLAPTGGYRSGRAETWEDLGTMADGYKRYVGVTTALHKREGTVKASVSYTWSRLQGNVWDDNSEYGINPAKDRYYLAGYLPDDSRHTIRAQAAWQMTSWLSGGIVYRYYSGRPYRRRYYNSVLANWSDLRARSGVNPGNNLNDPGDDRELRLPGLTDVNLQLRGNLRPFLGVGLEAYVDAINVLALRTTTNVEEQDGPAFGTERARKGPFSARFGFRYRY
jgi:hypothetical protein